MQLDRLADLTRSLPLAMDPVGVVHSTASQILEPRVAVEPTAVLAELCEPGPDLLGGGIDRDGVRRLDRVVRSEFVAWERLACVVRRRAPVEHPGPDRCDVDRCRRDASHGMQRRSAPSNKSLGDADHAGGYADVEDN